MYCRQQITWAQWIYFVRLLFIPRSISRNETRRKRTHKTPTPLKREQNLVSSAAATLVTLLGVFFCCPMKFSSTITSLEFDVRRFYLPVLTVSRCVRWFYLMWILIIHIINSYYREMKWDFSCIQLLRIPNRYCIRPNFVWFNDEKTNTNHCALYYKFVVLRSWQIDVLFISRFTDSNIHQ